MIGMVDIFQHPDIYKLKVVSEMKKMGASKEEIALVKNDTIMDVIKSKRNPSDVARRIMW